MTAAAVSIGIMRDDGDFEILATLNNHNEQLSAENFNNLIGYLRNYYNEKITDCVQVLERQDAPAIINTDPDSWAT